MAGDGEIARSPRGGVGLTAKEECGGAGGGNLPGVLDEIAEVAGREAALALALHMGGRDIHVPKPRNVGAGHRLAAVMGLEAARSFAGRFRGEQIYVPKARRALTAHLSGQGMAVSRIAERLGISRATAYQYRKTQRSMLP